MARELTKKQIQKLDKILRESKETIYCFLDLPKEERIEIVNMTDNELAVQQIDRRISDFNYKKILEFNALRGH